MTRRRGFSTTVFSLGIGRFFQGVQGASSADIAIMTLNGKDVRILTDGSANYGLPSWSPDERQIVFRLAGKERHAYWGPKIRNGFSRDAAVNRRAEAAGNITSNF